MNRHQYFALTAFASLFLILLFGLSTKGKEQKYKDKERALNMSVANINIMLDEKMAQLSGPQRSTIQFLMADIQNETDSLKKIENYQQLVSTWYSYDEMTMAGHYQQQLAQYSGTPSQYGFAGITFAKGIKSGKSDKEREYCRQQALQCFDQAISLEPDEIRFAIDKAIILAEYPEQNNPMKGIQMLLNLNKNHPKNVHVINNLAKFALQTNQIDKAKERLLSALDLEPNNILSNCLMVQLMEITGTLSGIETYKAKCESKN